MPIDEDPTIEAITHAAGRFVGACVSCLMTLLRDGTPARRAAATLLLRDFANGELPALPEKTRARIAARLHQRLVAEANPVVRDLIAIETAAV